MRLTQPSNAAKRAAIAATLLAVLGAVSALALASPAPPPAPRITVHPPERTRNRRAIMFGFTDSQPNVSFLCSTDASPFRPCDSPTVYAVRPPGANRFRVEARNASGAVSSPAIFSWVIDLAAPRLTVTFPVKHAHYGATAWRAGCTPASGVCGTVRAPSGLRAVLVFVRDNATNRYWNGRRFSSRRVLYRRALITPRPRKGERLAFARWFYPLPFPRPAGNYTIRVRATDLIGNVTLLHTERTVAFTSATSVPRSPTITSEPPSQTTAGGATFGFTDSEAPVTYWCKLDGAGWQPCASPSSYVGLATGTHIFEVRAVDRAGNVSPPALYSWTVTVAGAGSPFSISGDVSGSLYPGSIARAIPLTLTNPGSSAIYVTSLTATLQDSNLPAGCDASAFQIAQASIPSAGVAIPANGAVTLPTQGATAPTIQMLDTGTNQDACENADLTLGYSGSAHS